VGTPSGVSLSPEGAQHGWKSDFQIPNLVTWEPAFIQELDWIFADSVKRHMTGDNLGRQSVLLRLVTMSIDQKMFMECLQTQKRFEGREKAEILAETRLDVLAGGYWLLNYEGFEGYAPGDNVVHLFAMGTLVPQAVEASRKLLEQGIYANVCVVTSPDLLHRGWSAARAARWSGGGEPAHIATLLGALSPTAGLITVIDGSPGTLSWIGGVRGNRVSPLGIDRFGQTGDLPDLYREYRLDAQAIVDATAELFL
jgi:pyruvate dehydrogenase E1 component